MRLIQMCNVANVVGGTGACAWSVTKALPEVDHVIVFRTFPNSETSKAFAHCQIKVTKELNSQLIRKWAGDFLILHNTSSKNVSWNQSKPSLTIPVLQYAHSALKSHAGANLTVACSQFLAQKMHPRQVQVVYQGAACPEQTAENCQIRSSKKLVVGRICTPCSKKWPEVIIPFYQKLAINFPEILWEFVGCPHSMQSRLADACGQQAIFYRAGWEARKLMHRWHVLLYHNARISETFGRTVAEAMLTGCVPIVDRAGGFCEQIHSQDGYLCDSQNDFLNHLKKLTFPEVWRRRSFRCQQSAEALFSLTSFRKNILNACLSTIEMHSVR